MTIVFQIWKNYPNKTFLDLNLTFFVLNEYFHFGKFEGTDFKYDINFFKFLKNTQVRYAWSQIYGFLFLYKTFRFGKFEGADFKYDNSFSKLLPKNTQIGHFCKKRFGFDKFESADFKYENSFLKLLPKNTPK